MWFARDRHFKVGAFFFVRVSPGCIPHELKGSFCDAVQSVYGCLMSLVCLRRRLYTQTYQGTRPHHYHLNASSFRSLCLHLEFPRDKAPRVVHPPLGRLQVFSLSTRAKPQSCRHLWLVWQVLGGYLPFGLRCGDSKNKRTPDRLSPQVL